MDAGGDHESLGAGESIPLCPTREAERWQASTSTTDVETIRPSEE